MSDTWSLGPEVPLPSNHGMAASVDGQIKSTRGPAGKDFDESLGATATDLAALFRRLSNEGPALEDVP